MKKKKIKVKAYMGFSAKDRQLMIQLLPETKRPNLWPQQKEWNILRHLGDLFCAGKITAKDGRRIMIELNGGSKSKSQEMIWMTLTNEVIT